MSMSIFNGRTPYDRAKEEKPDHHFCVDLLPKERERLLALLEEGRNPTIAERRALTAKIKYCVRRDGDPLPVASLDWKRAEREAKRRGGSMADYLWDFPKNPPPAA